MLLVIKVVFLMFISHSSVSAFDNLDKILDKIISETNFITSSYV